MLRLMLDSHPDITIGPETHFIPSLIEQYSSGKLINVGDFIRLISSSDRWKDFGLEVSSLENYVNSAGYFSLSKGLQCFYELYAKKQNKMFWGDKTPGYILHMRSIQEVLPAAQFIHIIRDGRDVALSIKDLWFGPNNLQDAAVWWRDRILSGIEQSSHLKYYLEVRYEDLVLQPELTLRKILKFLGLTWSNKTLSYYENAYKRLQEIDTDLLAPNGLKISGKTRIQMHKLALNNPDPNRIKVWQTKMSDLDLKLFLNNAGDLLQKLGYEV